MSRRVTIVMYHFIRNLTKSRYPRLKGLSAEEFKSQLDFISRHYQVISCEDVMAAVMDGSALPEKALLLTFDDGYAEHFDIVLPLLHDRGWTGCFFPPAAAVLEGRVLDVNKIHFALAAVDDPKEIVAFLMDAVDRECPPRRLPTSKDYFAAVAKAGRFDTADIIFVKRMLQRELPPDLRAKLSAEIFQRFVTDNELVFAKELYVTVDQLRMMRRLGMCIGSHGYDHVWMNALTTQQQRVEIERGLDLLTNIGVSHDGWVMCYPYGAWNEALLNLLPGYGCVLGLGVEVAIADLDRDRALVLPRIDTNDLPKRASEGNSERAQ